MKSESLGDMSVMLCKAQSQRNSEIEGKIINKIINPTIKTSKDLKYNKNINLKIFARIAYGASDCWYWVGRLNQHGYGTYDKNLAHRVVWKHFGNDIPDNMYLLHKCDVRNCVNPDHLYIGDQFDNMKDMMDRKRNANKTTGKKYVNF